MTTAPSVDIVHLLTQDHRAAEELLTSYDQIPVVGRDDYFWEVVRELVAHEVAEEVVVYPALRADSVADTDEIDRRIEEQNEAEHKLVALEHLDPQSAEFDSGFKDLRQAVLQHAKSEEAHIFPLLIARESEPERASLGERYERAKASAPTHPHPHVPDTPPGNLVAGPVAAVFDRVRDTLRGR